MFCFSVSVITVYQCKVDDLPPLPPIDILIYDPLSSMLPQPSKLKEILATRALLKESGKMFPSNASLYVAGIEDSTLIERRVEWWSSVYGFDMSVMKPAILNEPYTDTYPYESLICDPAPLCKFDFHKCTSDALSFTQSFQLKIRKTDYLHAIGLFTSLEFNDSSVPITLDVLPSNSRPWGRCTAFYLNEPLLVSIDDLVTGMISVSRDTGNSLTVTIKLVHNNVVKEKSFTLM